VVENCKHILDAAARLFRERGFEGMTVAEIVNASGLMHAAIYGHFGSKDDLIAEARVHVLTLAKLPSDLTEFAARYLTDVVPHINAAA